MESSVKANYYVTGVTLYCTRTQMKSDKNPANKSIDLEMNWQAYAPGTPQLERDML